MTEVLSFHNHEVSPINEQENEFAMHLKPVFDACDYSGDGYVKIQDLIDLGKQHSVGNSGEVRRKETHTILFCSILYNSYGMFHGIWRKNIDDNNFFYNS